MISYNNRTNVPVIYRNLVTRFSDNDTVNCPILVGSLQIDKVVDMKTGEDVPFLLYSPILFVNNDILTLMSTKTLL